MIKPMRLLTAAAGTTIALASATPASIAMADQNTPSSESLTDPVVSTPHNQQAALLGTNRTIEVVADNLDYAHAKPTHLMLPFHVEAKSTKHRWYLPVSYLMVGLAPIKSAGVTGTCCGQLDADELSPYSYAVMLDHPSSTRHIDMDAWWALDVVPDTEGIATAAVNACRNMRDELQHQGLHSDEIFGTDRQTSLDYDFRFVASVAYMRGFASQETFWKQSQPRWEKINVVCKKRDGINVSLNPDIPPASDDITLGFQVTQAALAISPDTYEGRCPVELHLNPTLVATGKGKVRYRFRDQLGNKSQIFEVNFTKPDTKFLDHTIRMDAKGKPDGLGFTSAQGSGEFGFVAQTSPNLKQGYFQLEVLEPHKKMSNIADYSVKCTFSTHDGGLVAPPDTVNPVIVEGLTGAQLSPDLYVRETAFNPLLPNKVIVTVTNQGKGAAKATNLKAFYWVGNQSGARGTSVPAMGPGESQVVQAEVGALVEQATSIVLHIDDPNRLREENEANNSYLVK